MIILSSSRARVALLGLLYLSQGLPYGLQAKALPVWLREQGLSLESIGLLGLLAAPWMLKVLWAPLVDRWHVPALGRRRSWILPTQLGLAACALAAATLELPGDLFALALLVLLMNLFAATMDIAVDGWAVDLLGEGELGPANAAQVVGYKLGMLLSGGLLVAATARVGWSGLLLAIAGITLAVTGVVALVREDGPAPGRPPPEALSGVVAALLRALTRPGMGRVLAVIGGYKLGETLIDAMFKPFLIDQGFTAAQLGLWLGTWGTLASLLGSLAGGLLAARVPLGRALVVAAALRLLPQAAQVGLAALAGAGHGLDDALIIGVTVAEHALGGLLTTVMFAWMMRGVDRAIGASHFTALASVEVLGKLGAGLASGLLAARLGYTATFAAGLGLGVAHLALVAQGRARGVS